MRTDTAYWRVLLAPRVFPSHFGCETFSSISNLPDPGPWAQRHWRFKSCLRWAPKEASHGERHGGPLRSQALRVTEEPSGLPSFVHFASAFHVGNIIADFSVSSPGRDRAQGSTGAQVAPRTSSMGLLGPGLWVGLEEGSEPQGLRLGGWVSLLWASQVLSKPARAGQDAARVGLGSHPTGRCTQASSRPPGGAAQLGRKVRGKGL